MHIDLRNLSFIRHAKSSWDDMSLPDIHRPLNKRGERDAPLMAMKMMELGNKPELILTSPAKRAHTTAQIFADAADLPSRKVIVNDVLYGAGVSEIVEAVNQVDDQVRSVFVFGHNPTMTILANAFAGVDIDNVPTCGVLHVKTMVQHWKDWSPEVSAFVGFYYPKQYV